MDRNLKCCFVILLAVLSLSARRAWIEMLIFVCWMAPNRSLSARRAWIEISPAGCWRDSRRVALRKESVDRNMSAFDVLAVSALSLSARRAWIEMDWASVISAMTSVALRKESVDRNDIVRPAIDVFLASLSARRAWIEILMQCQAKKYSGRRSPQGERG